MKILLLQLKRIGDLVLTTPAIQALRRHFPGAEITLVVANEAAGLLPAIRNVDAALTISRNLRDLALFFAVARRKFDCCIDFTRNDRSALLAFLSGAPQRVVSSRAREQSQTRVRAYTDFVPVRVRDLHTIDYHLALLEPLGVQQASPSLDLQLPPEADERANALRRAWEIEKPYVILHPGSARREKLWEPQRWSAVIEHLDRNNGLHLVLTSGGSRTERDHVEAIKKQTGQRVTDLSGKTDLLTLGALIAKAQLLVTVDSAPMHLAAAAGTPQVILFGPTNPFHWRPRESPAVILQGKSGAPVTRFVPVQPRCAMSEISTEAVINAMDWLLSPRLATQPS